MTSLQHYIISYIKSQTEHFWLAHAFCHHDEKLNTIWVYFGGPCSPLFHVFTQMCRCPFSVQTSSFHQISQRKPCHMYSKTSDLPSLPSESIVNCLCRTGKASDAKQYSAHQPSFPYNSYKPSPNSSPSPSCSYDPFGASPALSLSRSGRSDPAK